MTREKIEVFVVGPAHPEDGCEFYPDLVAAVKRGAQKSVEYHATIYIHRKNIPVSKTAAELAKLLTEAQDNLFGTNGRLVATLQGGKEVG